jgi:tetratricopeptide (TPR) repeat protein
MEQTLSEVTSLDSIPVNAMTGGTNATDSLSNSSRSSSSNNKQMWNLHLHIWLLVVELYIKLDQLNEAESTIFEGVNMMFGPLSHQLMYVKGLLLKERNRLLEAKTFLQNAISINPNHARGLQQLGHVYYLLGNHLAADKYLRDSLKIDSTLQSTWSFMALVLDSMGDSAQATKCQQTALLLESTAPILPFSIVSRAVFE